MKKLVLKSEQGFTLVELMVVVAIIGILSAIAVPNFKKYQAKSKQSEAKIQLAALYSAEVGTSADYDTYATCLSEMGYEQSPRGYYIIGFNTGYNASAQFANCTAGTINTVVSGVTQNDLTNLKFATAPKSYLSALVANRPSVVSAGQADQSSFTAGAEGSISATGGKDVWSIDNTKKLNNGNVGY